MKTNDKGCWKREGLAQAWKRLAKRRGKKRKKKFLDGKGELLDAAHGRANGKLCETKREHCRIKKSFTTEEENVPIVLRKASTTQLVKHWREKAKEGRTAPADPSQKELACAKRKRCGDGTPGRTTGTSPRESREAAPESADRVSSNEKSEQKKRGSRIRKRDASKLPKGKEKKPTPRKEGEP